MKEIFHLGREEDVNQLTKKPTTIRITFRQSKKTMPHFNKQLYKIQAMLLTNLK